MEIYGKLRSASEQRPPPFHTWLALDLLLERQVVAPPRLAATSCAPCVDWKVSSQPASPSARTAGLRPPQSSSRSPVAPAADVARRPCKRRGAWNPFSPLLWPSRGALARSLTSQASILETKNNDANLKLEKPAWRANPGKPRAASTTTGLLLPNRRPNYRRRTNKADRDELRRLGAINTLVVSVVAGAAARTRRQVGSDRGAVAIEKVGGSAACLRATFLAPKLLPSFVSSPG